MDLEKFLTKNYCFSFNEVREKVLVKTKKGDVESSYEEMTDRKHNSILRKAKKKHVNVSSTELKHLLNSDFVKSHCPFREYFENLSTWDGSEDYIGQLASTIETSDDEYFRWCLKKWLVALVACSLDKNVVNQTVLIIAGRQGVGKTTWLKNILPVKLRSYFAETRINPSSKDSTILLTEKILVNMDELTSFNKRNAEQFKELITKQVITERKPYGTCHQDYVRRASFSGTTNHYEFLTDITGNRRYLCIKVNEINYNHSVDLSMVYSQAYSLYKSGFQYYFDDKDVERVDSNNENFRSISPIEAAINQYFEKPNNNGQKKKMSATEIVDFLRLKIGTNFSAIKVGKMMTIKGFQKKGKNKLYEVKLTNL